VFWQKDLLRVLRGVGKGEHRDTRSVHPQNMALRSPRLRHKAPPKNALHRLGL